jgi:small nuclear ribonucleoprotein (snRNP)-like protein
MSRSLGIPVKLLHEAAGHVVTVELKTGEVYRGSMVECEDNWNRQLDNITFTAKVLPLLLFHLSISLNLIVGKCPGRMARCRSSSTSSSGVAGSGS